MKEQFSHKLISSFYLWMDNYILDKGKGWVNKTGTFRRQKDNSAPTTYSWAAPHQQLVWDASVYGATIFNNATTTSGNVLTRESGIKFDYINGRILSNHDWGNTLTATYAKKDFNIYTAEEDDVDLYLENILDQNVNLPGKQTGIPPYQFVAPCMILTLTNNVNEPFAFGGQDKTNTTIRAFVIANNKFHKESLESLCVDSARSCVTLFPNMSVLPITEYGDVKGSGYSYKYIRDYFDNQDIYIDSVEAIKIGEKTNKNKNFYLSLIEFDLSTIRFPRQEVDDVSYDWLYYGVPTWDNGSLVLNQIDDFPSGQKQMYITFNNGPLSDPDPLVEADVQTEGIYTYVVNVSGVSSTGYWALLSNTALTDEVKIHTMVGSRFSQ
jgi:hypothetical protein